MRFLVRFVFRITLLALAAVGAKTLYDRLAPKAADLRGPASDVLDSAKGAAQDVTHHARAAAADVVDDARKRAGEVRDQASAVVDQAQSDQPTVAPPTTPLSAPV
jgi:hypothetical protein